MTDGVHIRLTLTRGVKYTSGMDPRVNTAGPTLIVLAEHKPPVYGRGGIALVTNAVRRVPARLHGPQDPSLQSDPVDPGEDQANQAGADNAVMLDVNGFVAETNATHLFLVVNGSSPGRVDGGGGPVAVTPRCVACPEGTEGDGDRAGPGQRHRRRAGPVADGVLSRPR